MCTSITFIFGVYIVLNSPYFACIQIYFKDAQRKKTPQRWLWHIFNCNAWVYQTATQWDLPPYQITIWVIDWWCNVCLFTWWIDSRFSGLEISAGHQTMSDVKPGMSDAKSPYTWQSWPTCFRAVKNTLLTVWYIISLCAY